MRVWPEGEGGAGFSRIAAGALLLMLVGAAVAQQQPEPLERYAPAAPTPAPAAPGQPAAGAAPQPGIQDPPRYLVSRVVIRYTEDREMLPDPEEVLRSATVELGVAATGYVEPSGDVARVRLRVSQIAEEPMRRFSAGALAQILRAVLREYAARGVAGVQVDAGEDIYLPLRPNPQTGAYELDTADPDYGKDLRPERRPEAPTEFQFVVSTAVVTQVRTQAVGERIDPAKRINAREHARILARSPVQPASVTGDGPRRDVLRKDLVDDYMHRLNRHPGRRVDAAVSAGEGPDEITLDYLVNESKPWSVYFQLSNTGTEETAEWRERFGFSHNQLTGNDDILNLDFVTAGFENTFAFLASYEAPLGNSEQWRWRAYGNWNEFTASDVGFSTEDFDGEGWTVGGDLIRNFYQRKELFVDAVAGLRWQNVGVDNNAAMTTGDSNFLLPSIGVRLERQTELSTTLGSISLEGNLAGAAGTSETEIQLLGRDSVDASWVAFKFDLLHSFYIEPLVDRRWGDPTTNPTLAHEVVLAGRGQWVPDGKRVIPSFEQVIGGFYTVRGYPESTAAGDTVVAGTLEYRFHFPWGRTPGPPGRAMGRQFRWRPQQAYGRADWDLALRAFLDAGYAYNNERQSFENNELLVGTGLGLELTVRRNLSLRVDWGVALADTNAEHLDTGSGQFVPDVTAGSDRFHISATILY